MGFSDRQIRALSRGVPARAIRSRMRAGKELTYIEGWYALTQANRIFGFDSWDRETVETKCLLARETRGNYTAIYSATVRVTVRTNDAIVVRDGHGTGEAHGASAGEVHDRALKAAETDATKRALATFGKAFGLALYAGERRAQPTHIPGNALNGATVIGDGRAPPSGNFETPVAPRADGVADDRHVAVLGDGDDGGSPVPIQSERPTLRQRIEKSALAFPEPRRVRDKNHLRFVASQPCLLCRATPSDAHHVRFAQPRAMARKVSATNSPCRCAANITASYITAATKPLGGTIWESTRPKWQKTCGIREKGKA
jgi:hypothetical protein